MKHKTTILSAIAATAFILSGFTPALTSQPLRAESHFVGELYGGGIIFSVTKAADGTEHGLIASLKDLSDGVEWSDNTRLETGASSPSNGAANTEAIVKAKTPKGDAAGLCDGYSEGSFSDWYLPAADELKALQTNAAALNKILESKGEVLGTRFYWSSTETGRGSANGVDFTSGAVTSSNKLRNAMIRAVRAF